MVLNNTDMANNEVKYRPATMAEIEGRDTDLYMDGEQVWVMMICRSETIGEGEPKLDYIMLTNMKKVQVEDLQVIDNNNNEPEDKTMATTKNINETKNVQNAQVTNNAAAIVDVNVGEVSVNDIMPKMTEEPAAPTKQEVATAISKAANEGKATTMPLGSHGTLVIAGVPKRDKNGKFLKKSEDKPKAAAKPSKLSVVRLVTYKTKKGADAPMIVGFGGDDDPRWKKHFDAKPKWVSAGFRRDMESNKVCHLMFGAKYMDVAKALCDAYNTDEREAWAKAEQACADNYNGIVAGYQAEKAARRAAKQAEREAAKAAKAEQSAAPAMSSEEQAMFDLFKKFMAGDKEAMAKVGAVLNKAA